jgi:hemolysin activation/secretion protein
VTQGLGTILGGVKTGAKFASGVSRASRLGAGNDFTRFNTDIFYIHSIKKGRYLLLHGTGQLSSAPLPVSEQFGLGGSDSVRGYSQSEYLGDDGYLTSAELRESVFDRKSTHVQLLAFFDHGRAKLQSPLLTERPHRTMDGTGVGARASLGRHLTLRVDLGFPLSGDNVERERPYIYGQLSSRW